MSQPNQAATPQAQTPARTAPAAAQQVKPKTDIQRAHAQQQSKIAPKATTFCLVLDSNAKHGPRRHTIDGVNYDLNNEADPDKARKVPLAHAMKFLMADPSFIVFDPEGNRLHPTKTKTTGQALQKHETIATLAELTNEALFNRCQKLPNGLTMTLNTPRERKIEFIMAGGLGSHKVTEETDGTKDPEVEIDDDESDPSDVLGDGNA